MIIEIRRDSFRRILEAGKGAMAVQERASSAKADAAMSRVISPAVIAMQDFPVEIKLFESLG